MTHKRMCEVIKVLSIEFHWPGTNDPCAIDSPETVAHVLPPSSLFWTSTSTDWSACTRYDLSPHGLESK